MTLWSVMSGAAAFVLMVGATYRVLDALAFMAHADRIPGVIVKNTT
jgi:hypothetical protein